MYLYSCITSFFFFFFFNDTATTEIYTLSLHDALPIFLRRPALWRQQAQRTFSPHGLRQFPFESLRFWPLRQGQNARPQGRRPFRGLAPPRCGDLCARLGAAGQPDGPHDHPPGAGSKHFHVEGFAPLAYGGVADLPMVDHRLSRFEADRADQVAAKDQRVVTSPPGIRPGNRPIAVAADSDRPAQLAE